MWFAFGFITLLAAFAASMWIRYVASWRGEKRRTEDGVEYDYLERRHKGRLRGAWIGVAAPEELRFVIRSQGALDRWFKRIGLAAELEVRDAQFDEALYVESDVRSLGALLAGDAELRGRILGAFRGAVSESIKLDRIRCARGRLWIQLDTSNETLLRESAAEWAAFIAHFGTRLREMNRARESWRDPFVWRAAVLLSISTASAALGVLGFVRFVAGPTEVLDPWRMFAISAVVGTAALIAFALLVLFLLGRSSRTHLVLLEVLIVGGIGFNLSSLALAYEVNRDLDGSPARWVEVGGARAEHTTSRSKGRTHHHYHLNVPDWRGAPDAEPLRLEITASVFARLEHSPNVALAVRAGALGFEWIESYEPR